MKNSDATDINLLFAGWYKLYYKMINNLVIEKTGSKDIVQDIFHDSLMVIYEKMVSNELHVTVKMSTYLYSIANNKCHEYLRKQRKENSVTFDDEFEIADELGYDATKEAIIKQLELCVEKLPDTKKNIMLSYYYHKLKMDAIASKYELENSNSVKTQKYKAIIDLKNCFKKRKAA
jgi:RNA polymerase sigma factor (sigma-70 family)